ncbi:MAG: hypothetical protein RBU37_16480 [Myxococcota bacterium]|jgi:hypothetical protein|nr:hypothetical protein [Myxococcota bacterium]
MKMICERCEHVDEPSQLWLRGRHAALECAHCGALNRVLVEGEPEAMPVGADGLAEMLERVEARLDRLERMGGLGVSVEHGLSVPERAAAVDERAASDGFAELPQVAASSSEEELGESELDEEVVPGHPAVADAVAPVQCRKCGHRQETTDACTRCGFVFANDVEGKMAWDRLADSEHAEQASSLWTQALEEGTWAAHRRFSAFCLEHGLDDFAGRRYRFRASDRPDDVHARRQLEKMAERAQLGIVASIESLRLGDRERLAKQRKLLFLLAIIISLGVGAFFVFAFPNLFR